MIKKFIGILVLMMLASFFLLARFHHLQKSIAGIASTRDQTNIDEQTVNPEKFYAPILAYHHIALKRPQNSYFVSPKIFDKQMRWLVDNGYHVISFDKFYTAASDEGTLPEKPVVLTFDDGNVDNYTNALPILIKYDLTATFFIKINGVAKGGAGMTWEKLRQMSSAGMTIGSHSINHNNMAQMGDEELRSELVESKRILEKNLGIKVKYFAYPGGAYSKKTIAAVRDAGYLAAVTTKHKVNQEITSDDSLYTLPRVHIDDEMPTFIGWVQGKNLY